MTSASSFVNEALIRRVRLQLSLVLTGLLLSLSYGLLFQGTTFANSAGIGATLRQSLLSSHAMFSVLFFAMLALPVAIAPFLLVRITGSNAPVFPRLQLWSLRFHAAAFALAVLAVLAGDWTHGWPNSLPSTALGGFSGAAFALSLHLLGLCLIVSALDNLSCCLRNGVPSPRIVALWGFLVGAVSQILCAVALGALGVLIFFADRMTTLDASPLLLPRLVAFAESTALLSALLPAVAVGLQVVARSADRPVAGRWSNPFALVGILGLSIGGSGLALAGNAGLTADSVVRSTFTLLLLVPAATLALNLLYTLRGGAVRITGATLFALSSLLCAGLGGIAGIFLADLSVAAPLWLSSVQSVAFHYLWLAASVLVVAAILSAHSRELLGSELSTSTVRWAAAAVFVGVHLALLPRVELGLRGLWMADASTTSTGKTTESIALVGSVLLTLGLVLFAQNALRARLNGLRSQSNGES